MKTIAYIDGFNLYYGAVKGTPYKWLNLRSVCEEMLPEHDIVKVKYFTARVKGRSDDPSQPKRQNIFIRALRTIPDLEIVEGHFRKGIKTMRLVSPANDSPSVVEVLKFEEKGSDVNLASWMLKDGYTNAYDTAVVVSNDSDLVAPIEIVRRDLGKPVIVINPQKTRPSNELQRVASQLLTLTPEILEKCQLPDNVITPDGKTITKPESWNEDSL